MKTNIIALAVLSCAISASAASINWGFTGINKAASLITDSTDAAYSGDIYLILASDATSLEGKTSQADFESALTSIKLGTATVSNGKISTSQTANSPSLIAKVDGGSPYTFQVVVFDSTNLKYYLSATSTEYAYSPEGVAANTDAATSITFTKQMIGKGSSPSWSPAVVPEPNTAVLALAGLALLLKRRRA